MASPDNMPESSQAHKEPATMTAQGRYTALAVTREDYLIRARRLARLTITSMFRELGDNATTDQEVPWNSMGAYGANNLAAKLVLSLFPPGTPFVKLKMSKKTLSDLSSMSPDDRGQLKSVIDLGYSEVEKAMVECMDEDGDRASLTNAARRQLVGGTHGFQFYDDGTSRGIPLDRFVCVRDGAGALIEFIVEDNLAWNTIPEDVQDACKAAGFDPQDESTKDETIPVYTHGCLSDGMWTIYQEVKGIRVDGSTYVRTPDAMPFLFVPFILLEGEHYGRSYVEDYEGDLQTVEGNTQAITEYGAAVARYVQMVNPTGLTSKRAIASAKNGDVISGRAEDVTTLQSEKMNDMQVVMSITQQASDRLTRAFLLASAVVRQGERVTAEEIRTVANELEQSLGGVYSQAVVAWQAPYAKLKLHYLQIAGRVPKLPAQSTKAVVIAGMAGLGRNAELQALDDFMTGAAQLLGPTVLQQAINPRVYMNRRAAALHIDVQGLVYSEEEAAQNAQQQAMSQTASQVAPALIQQYGAKQVADTNAQAKVDAANISADAQAPQAQAPQG